jgi:hypothetical protein
LKSRQDRQTVGNDKLPIRLSVLGRKHNAMLLQSSRQHLNDEERRGQF